IKADLGAVTVHAGQQQLPRPQLNHFLRPLHGIQPGWLATAVGKDFPARLLAFCAHALGIDGHDYALPAKTLRCLPHKLGIEDCSRIDGDLVGSGIEQLANVIDGAHATAHGQRDEHFRRHALYGFVGGVADFTAGGDVQKGDFVRALLVVATGLFHRVAGIADIDKVDAFNHAAFVDVQTGDNAFCQCHCQSSLFQAVAIGLRFGHIQSAFVDGAAGDRTDHAFVGDGGQALEVIHIGNAARSDYGDTALFCQFSGGFHVYALHHAVTGNVGVNDGGHAVVGEALGKVYGHDFGDFGPAVDGYAAVFGVQRSEEHTSELQSRENLVCR